MQHRSACAWRERLEQNLAFLADMGLPTSHTSPPPSQATTPTRLRGAAAATVEATDAGEAAAAACGAPVEQRKAHGASNPSRPRTEPDECGLPAEPAGTARAGTADGGPLPSDAPSSSLAASSSSRSSVDGALREQRDERTESAEAAALAAASAVVAAAAAGKSSCVNYCGVTLPPQLNLSGPELRRLCKQGVPPELRCLVWPMLLRMRAPLEPSAAEYATLRQAVLERMTGSGTDERRGASVISQDLISQDLERTFPSLGLFAEGSAMRSRLSEVLWVYASMADGLSYQQGMSHLAATLLLHLHEGRLTCAALNALLVGYPVLRACLSMHVAPALEFFEATLAVQLPDLAARLRALDLTADMYAVPWLLTMFARSLPLSTACRVWDRVLSEGERALFCAAVALMQATAPPSIRASSCNLHSLRL